MPNKQLEKKLQTCKYAIALGNFAYTPADISLTSWTRTDGKEINKTLEELEKKYLEDWFKSEFNRCIENQKFSEILLKANPSSEEWQKHFLKVICSNEEY
jgi:hypothetical protein